MSGDCACDCGVESWTIIFVDSGGTGESNPVGGSQDVVRGSPQGDVNASRPVSCVIHTDWCANRPTKAAVKTSAYGNANGTVRVFVEATRDLSTQLFAEVQVEAAVAFPTFDEKHHFADGQSRFAGEYPSQQIPNTVNFTGLPIFGTSTDSLVFAPRNVADGSTYLTSPWPLIDFHSYDRSPLVINNHYEATRRTVRCGYRSNGQETIVADFLHPSNEGSYDVIFNQFSSSPGFRNYGAVAIGCSWKDIVDPNQSETVRCGFEVTGGVSFGQETQTKAATSFGSFTFPFDVPRSLFVDQLSQATPKSADTHRYIGLAATEQVVQAVSTAGVGGFLPPEDSRRLLADSCDAFVVCGANHANVVVDPDESQDVATVPVVAMRGTEQPPAVDASAPFFIRRPDIIDRGRHAVANANSWHATHLVRRGSPLATRNAIYNLVVEFVADSRQVSSPVLVSSTFVPPSVLYAQADSYGWGVKLGNGFNNANDGVSLRIEPLEDFVINSGLSNINGSTPPLWFWSGIAGEHTLTPFVGNRRLMPNAWHKFSSQAHQSRSVPIVSPPGTDLRTSYSASANGWVKNNFIGTYTEAGWAAVLATQAPISVGNYRVAYTIESFPQIWATTHLSGIAGDLRPAVDIPPSVAGPLDASLADSGMTTENYDVYVRRQAGVQPSWINVNAKADAIVSLHIRLGTRISISKVQGFREVGVKGGQAGFGVFYYNPTGEVEIAGDHDCSDVACTEFFWGAGVDVGNFRPSPLRVALTWADREALASGSQVEKQLPYATVTATGQQLFRTVRLRLETQP